MSQTRTASFTEVCLNTASGFIVAYLLWMVVGPLMGYAVSHRDNFIITSIFTVASIARSYVWRRMFNRL
jgi:uncharacterized membrane protein